MIILCFPTEQKEYFQSILALQLMLSKALPLASQTHLQNQTRPSYRVLHQPPSFMAILIVWACLFVAMATGTGPLGVPLWGWNGCLALTCVHPHTCAPSFPKNYGTSCWTRHLLPSQQRVYRFCFGRQIYWMWQVMLRRVSHISPAPLTASPLECLHNLLWAMLANL